MDMETIIQQKYNHSGANYLYGLHLQFKRLHVLDGSMVDKYLNLNFSPYTTDTLNLALGD